MAISRSVVGSHTATFASAHNAATPYAPRRQRTSDAREDAERAIYGKMDEIASKLDTLTSQLNELKVMKV